MVARQGLGSDTLFYVEEGCSHVYGMSLGTWQNVESEPQQPRLALRGSEDRGEGTLTRSNHDLFYCPSRSSIVVTSKPNTVKGVGG
jgi:hypothetical protein